MTSITICYEHEPRPTPRIRRGGRARRLTAAARAIGVSQPAVSRAVRDLERSCGFELLERTPHGIWLTRAGESFLLNAREVIGAMRTAEEAVAALGGLGHGRLHIGASTTIATYVLPAFVGRFLEEHPAVD